MRFGIAGFVAVCLLIPGAVRAESGELLARPLLLIRTYNTYRLSNDNLRVAEDSAAAVLSAVGIDVRMDLLRSGEQEGDRRAAAMRAGACSERGDSPNPVERLRRRG